jgi:hypothetical protein
LIALPLLFVSSVVRAQDAPRKSIPEAGQDATAVHAATAHAAQTAPTEEPSLQKKKVEEASGRSSPAAQGSGTTAAPAAQPATRNSCNKTIKAAVVALDQTVMINRLGAVRPDGMIYALEGDVVPSDGQPTLRPGKVTLRDGKRPRPIVLRVNRGDCLRVRFRNLLAPDAPPQDPAQSLPQSTLGPVTRSASVHVAGMQLVDDMADDGTFVGANPRAAGGNESGIVAPGGSATYTLFAGEEGAFLLYSMAANYNGFNQMQLMMGLFGAVNVEPAGAEWYRSQVTASDLEYATKKDAAGKTARTALSQPVIDYDAVYPKGHPRAGLPVLRMLDREGQIVHSDLTAVITGPGRGNFPASDPHFKSNPALPERTQPFREVTVHYHESQDVVQAFPYFYNPANANSPNVNAGQDSFAINYGIAGIGPEILANRLGVGPARDCVDCKFEEFFLSSWAGGDPAMIVDVPANAACDQQIAPYATDLSPLAVQTRNGQAVAPAPCAPVNAPKATKAFFPDDPSNVYHSYLNDHVRFRILHAGASVHHVHHHHAHQWLHTPDSAGSNYLDSQAIGPGSSYTLELVYGGSGNRNRTVGDAIFHCHFYPHFASGMWALYRVHDVFEAGTPLDAAGRPAAGARAMPDGEITNGTPIPALVPLPTLAMAPMPGASVSIVNGQVQISGAGNPGYPFFVPGVAGHRPPHPPLDFAPLLDASDNPVPGQYLDGGLPRHVVLGGTVSNEQHTPTDFTKDLSTMAAAQLPEEGTPSEVSAINYFGQYRHPSFTPEGTAADFKTNGLPNGPQRGAPFADPAVEDGRAVAASAHPRRYKGANIQVNNVFNKAGWHFPQQRMIALWGDVKPTIEGKRPPEPFFFRANNGDVVEFWHTDLVPAYYELDDFQVRTPTDILGQHIHLVKFDVMASDGAANGWNYEDGTFSPDEVRARISAINAAGGLLSPDQKTRRTLVAKSIRELGDGPGAGSKAWLGAQATVQRWWVDPIGDLRMTEAADADPALRDRSFMTVFTHDHFGPSTHQMVGLYGGLLVEPTGASWTFPGGKPMGGPVASKPVRFDGGPTAYAANVITANEADSYREFALAWQDLQFAYLPASKDKPDCYEGQTPVYNVCAPVAPGLAYRGWADPANAVNKPAGSPTTIEPFLIGDFGAGMFSMNYRTEPLPLRVFKPSANVNRAATAEAGDLSHVFRSIPRYDGAFSTQPAGGSPINAGCTGPACFTFPVQPISDGMGAADPYTPLLRAFEGDKVQVRVLVGAHTSMHDFTVHGVKWLFEPYEPNSGYRNTQFVILSEHYEMLFNAPRTPARTADYLYNPSSSYEGLVNGLWGLFRVYKGTEGVAGLKPLPNNAGGRAPGDGETRIPGGVTAAACGTGAPCLREFNVSAVTVGQALGDGQPLVYNSRGVYVDSPNQFDSKHPLADPLAIIYVRDEDLDTAGRLKPGVPVEPLVLRAAAGDWIRVRLSNRLTGNEPVFQPSNSQSASRPGGSIPFSNPYANVQLSPSTSVGLHPQLLAFDVTRGDGANVGVNPLQTVSPRDAKCTGGNFPCREYVWYAGTLNVRADGTTEATPVEFGSINLTPSDPLMHVYRGLFGALVVEPEGSQWIEDTDSRASATVFPKAGRPFREFALMAQDDFDVQLNGNSLYASGNPLSAFNYRTEPFFYRYGSRLDGGLWIPVPGVPPGPPKDWTSLSANDLGNINALSFTGTDTSQSASNELVGGDPQTPIFRAPAGMPVRFRLLDPGGIGDNQQVFELTGHVWPEEPYTKNSTAIGDNPKSNWTGTTTGYGTTSHYDIVIPHAGGANGVAGDYLYRSWTANQYQVGLWGLFRVAPVGRGSACAARPETCPDTVTVSSAQPTSGPGGPGFTVRGVNTVSPATRQFSRTVTVSYGAGPPATVNVDDKTGRWTFTGRGPMPNTISVRSAQGGLASYRSYAVTPPEAGRARPALLATQGRQIAPRRKRPRH